MKVKNQHNKTSQEIKNEYKIILLAKSNPDKFELIYNKYYKNIFAFIYNRTDNKELTSDLTSHVFLKAMLNIKTYTFKGVPFSAWLFRIAINEVNSYYRKTKQIRTVSIDKVGLENLEDTVYENNIEEKTNFILNKLSSLDEKSMQIIELRFFEKLTFNEISVILGISVSNAKVRLHRVIKKLKSKAEKLKSFLISLFL